MKMIELAQIYNRLWTSKPTFELSARCNKFEKWAILSKSSNHLKFDPEHNHNGPSETPPLCS